MFQTIGILPDGLELVDMTEKESGLVVGFPDRAEEGWPGFQLHIPSGALFDQASTTLLARRASWDLSIPLESVVQHLTEWNEGFPLPAEDLKRNVTMGVGSGHELNIAALGFRLGGSVEVSLVGWSNGHTMGKRFSQGPQKP